MNPRLSPLVYQLLAALGVVTVAVTVVPSHAPWAGLVSLLVIVVGSGAVLIQRAYTVVAFLAVITAIQAVHFGSVADGPYLGDVRPLAIPEVLLAAGTLAVVGSLSRLAALRQNITPADPRLLAADRPMPPQQRPESAMTVDEIGAWILSLPVFVLVGEVIRLLFEYPPFADELLVAPLARMVVAVWLLVTGVFVVRAVFDHLRRTAVDPETARMYLQEVAWRDLRGDIGRTGRWLAWLRRRQPAPPERPVP